HWKTRSTIIAVTCQLDAAGKERSLSLYGHVHPAWCDSRGRACGCWGIVFHVKQGGAEKGRGEGCPHHGHQGVEEGPVLVNVRAKGRNQERPPAGSCAGLYA